MLFCFWDWFCKIIPVWKEACPLRLWRAGTKMKQKTLMFLHSPQIWKALVLLWVKSSYKRSAFWGKRQACRAMTQQPCRLLPALVNSKGSFLWAKLSTVPRAGHRGTLHPCVVPHPVSRLSFCSEPSSGQAQVRLSFVRHSTSCFSTYHLSLSVRRGKYLLLPAEDFF